jgi:hypothetical protein
MRTVRRECGGGAAGLENLLALVVDDDHFASMAIISRRPLSWQ